MIDLSVVVPFYNAERYIEECIKGLLSQNYPLEQYEVVMVDNNSTDGSSKIVQSYSRVKLVSRGKQGAYAARNRGLMAANGEFIAFTDPDCVPSYDWLQRIKESMKRSRTGIVLGNHGLSRHSCLLSMLADYEDEKNNYIFNSGRKELYYGYTRNMAVRRKLFDELGPFVEAVRGSDVIFVRKCIDRYSCEAVQYCPEAQVRHMELDTLNKYYRKVFIYGRSIQDYGRIVSARSLTNRERLLVLRRSVQAHRYSWMKSIFLAGLLAVGFIYWSLGVISAMKMTKMTKYPFSMVKSLLSKLYNKCQIYIKNRSEYPAMYNVNTVTEFCLQKRALLIYVVKPFLLSNDDPQFFTHQNKRQCRQIATLLGEFGYIVDCMDIKNVKFGRSRDYDLVVSNKDHVKDINTVLKEKAVKIYLSSVTNHIVHNQNLRKRHDLLWERRRYQVAPRRIYGEAMPYVRSADAIVGFGNEHILDTWKQVFQGPIYPFNNYGFKDTEFIFASKDFASARRNFLFFASGSQMQKSLDLLLEIFPRQPDLHLYVCGNFERERDFCACYSKELYDTPNVRPHGWVRVNSPEFYALVRQCAYVIHPTCSDGQAGSVVQCMYAGLIPLVTKEAGIDTEDFGVTFADDSLAELERVILNVSRCSADWHREQSLKTRRVAKEKYSEDAFLNRWRTILSEILHGAAAQKRPGEVK